LPSLRVVAGDSLIEGLEFASRRSPGQSFIQCDIRALPYEAEFDAVGAFDVLEHLDDDQGVLREMHRVMRPNGGLIVTVPQHRALWSAADEFSHHRRRYSRRELVRKLQAAGFRIRRVTSFMTFVLPVLFAARMGKRRVSDFDPVAELHISRMVNSALAAICGVETALIRQGMSWPVGGSLMAIAERP
jgi:SAM-dependent methyltransferase